MDTLEPYSVIIPALNEARFLPELLDALHAQTRLPAEILVADAGSTDGTTDLARARGARVIPGGRPAQGRNAGARAAACPLLIFLDADVIPPRDFAERALAEFVEGGYGVATCLIDTLDDEVVDRVLTEASNLYLQVVQPISPHAPGFCIIARRTIHEAIGGFDEVVKMAEDHDYVQRAAEVATFGILSSVRIPVSMRRLEKEGMTRLAVKYLWCELHALAGRPIYSMPFEYEFGSYLPAAPTGTTWRRMVDIGQLRAQLGRFDNPLHRLSTSGLEQLERLSARDWVEARRERLRLTLELTDLDTLHRYLQYRLAILRERERPVSRAWTKAKETIRILDWEWLRARLSGAGVQEEDESDE